MPIGDDTHAWRRDLPHLQKLGKTYFVTFVTYQRQELPPNERDIVLACITYPHRQTIYLHSAVVMPDHVHLLFTLFDDVTLPKLIQRLKSVSAHRVGHRMWQREYFDRIM